MPNNNKQNVKRAFLGQRALQKQIDDLPEGFKPPSKGYKKPFNYKKWNTLKKLGRVN